MGEALSRERHMTGDNMLFVIKRGLEIQKDIAELQEQVYAAGEPIRRSVGNLAILEPTPGKWLDLTRLDQAAKEAIARRAELHAQLDYMNADLSSTYLDTRQRLAQQLSPEDEQPATLHIRTKPGGHWASINYGHKDIREEPAFTKPHEAVGTYVGIDKSGDFYIDTGSHGRTSYIRVRPFDVNKLEPQVDIEIIYPE